MYNQVEIVKKFIENNKARFDIVNNNDDTLLHFAVLNSNLQIVEMLVIGYGVNPNCKNNRQATPLSIAINLGNKEIVDIIIQSKAHIYSRY